ncbi:hypothetical protein KsCSTR_08760 [Candidatus Kuenenia stuttgartiensis]|uniref:Uncharacterized protein n=1 Tax=Kuenenia stuttgartiensis TaxID=174633 RepID=Q1PZ75_KUEST|nr:hypothetical protein KsCSTR_08760 [Candidatus Kuenenia stuttgartiensis]CAJ72377.1 unknown protein [Candidatus Kuenenia stuttgartiensis]
MNLMGAWLRYMFILLRFFKKRKEGCRPSGKCGVRIVTGDSMILQAFLSAGRSFNLMINVFFVPSFLVSQKNL